MSYTVDFIKSVIGNSRTEKQIEKALANIPHERDIEGYDYYNIYIPRRYDDKPYIRVYINRYKEVIVQQWIVHNAKYSGIPVFFG